MRSLKIIIFLTSVLIWPALASAFSLKMSTAQIPLQTYLQQADEIYENMSLDEKVGQMLLPSYRLLAIGAKSIKGKSSMDCQTTINNEQATDQEVITACGLDQIAENKLGAVLQDGGPFYNAPTLNHWQKLNALAVTAHKAVQRDPILLIGNDAIHGNSHVQGAVIFPHNINLGVTHDVSLVAEIAALTANDSLWSGFNWIYMPTVAVAQDLRWGRTYESFGNDPELVSHFARAYVQGLQQASHLKFTGALACVKHFIGDGATQYGLDEGDVQFSGDMNAFWKLHGLGYASAIQAGVLNLMVSYSAINGERMHLGGPWNNLNQLKNYGIQGSRFRGFAVSDYNGATRAAYFFNLSHKNKLSTLPEILARTVNSGTDMLMLGVDAKKNPFDSTSPYYYQNVHEVAEALKSAVKQGLIAEPRFKEAVTHILAAKLAMQPQINVASYEQLQKKERVVALKAAEESLVLLKNEKHLLPLHKNMSQKIKYLIFIGETNDLGVQNGGWTINWQGQKGNQYFTGVDQASSGAKTIEQALPDVILRKFKIPLHIYHVNEVSDHLSELNATNTLVVTVVAEPPYAEYMGDIGNPHEVDEWYDSGIANHENNYMPNEQSEVLQLTWSNTDAETLNKLRDKSIPIVTIVYSGRPVVLTAGNAPLSNSNAVIAAFLPGTLGGDALANAMVGQYRFQYNHLSNMLTFPWPRNMQDVVDRFKNGELFKAGYGLPT